MSEALNITTAAFGGLREVTTAPLWQYDYGQILQITGLDLPQAFEVHFSNSRKSGETITQIGTDGQVTIPDMYLTSGADVYCFIFLHDGTDDGETEYVIKIPVRERPEPSDIEPTPEQQDAITEAIAALNSAVTQTGQDVISADASAQAAAQSATNAQTAATQAQGSATSASSSASTASTAAATASTKASEAATSAANAASAKTAAETAETNAHAAQIASESAQASAESAAQTATNKASEASTSATSASGSASAASASASQASESATNAAASATAASASATAAAGSASTASTKASEASASATAAQTAQTAAEAAQTAAETAAATFETDTTLTVSGKAADAKATGDEISDLKEDLDAEIELGSVEYNPYTSAYWRKGYVSPITGADASGLDYTIALRDGYFINPLDGTTFIEANTGYTFYLFAYEQDGTFVGCWNGNSFAKSWSWKKLTKWNLLAYKDYKFRITLNRDDEQSAAVSEYDNLVIWYSKFSDDGIRDLLNRGNLAFDTTKYGGYLGTNGALTQSTEQTNRETTSDFIPVSAGKEYVISVFVDTTVQFWGRVCLYDANKEYTQRYDLNTASETYLNFNYAVLHYVVPSGSSFMRISCRHGFFQLTKGVTEFDYMPSAVDIRRHWNLRPKQDYIVKSINHRGYGRIAPENTAPAFELSADLGFWGVENDIRHTSDGVPVLMHDETINRTGRNADGSLISTEINISDITYEQALTYDFGVWMGDKYAGTKILAYEDFIKLCRKKSLNCYNEIKDGTTQQIKNLVKTAIRNGMKDHVSWISFSSSYLATVLETQANARVGLIVSEITSETITILNGLKNSSNKVFVSCDINHMPDSSMIETLIDNDIELECYTTNFVQVIEGADPYVTGMTSDWCIAGDCLYFGVNNILLFD